MKTDTRPSVVDSRQGHRNRGHRSEEDRASHALGNGFIDTFRDHAERHAYLRDRWQGICSDSGGAEYLPNTAASRGKSLETEL